MRIRDGPAAVRGDAPPPRSHWPRAGKAAREGAPSQKTCRALHDPNPSRKGGFRCFARSVLLAAAALAALVAVAGASGAGSAPDAFPVTVIASNGKVTVKARRAHRLALADRDRVALRDRRRAQVVAVDDQSDYPKSAPQTSLSGFTPNVEAIAAYRPDLVVIAYDPKGLSGALGQARHHRPPSRTAAKSFKGAYQQIRQLGLVTGREPAASKLVASMRAKIGAIVKTARERGAALGVPRAHARPLLGDLEDLRRPGVRGARAAQHRRRGRRGRHGYPQLSAEYVVSSSPDLIVLADTVCCGQKASTVAARPAGTGSARCARARSCASTTRSRRAGGRGS